MSETVKLIVTLNKGQYENLKNIHCGSIGARMIVNAVQNGIPLDDVLYKISAEIEEKISRYDHFENSNTANGLRMAKEIVEKWKGGER